VFRFRAARASKRFRKGTEYVGHGASDVKRAMAPIASTAATDEIGRMPDQRGKNRKHWDNLHMKLQLRFLRAQLEAQQAERTTRRR